MRLQFESKLNSLYAAQRSLEGKLQLAKSEVAEGKVALNEKQKKIINVREQLRCALNDKAAVEKANTSMNDTIEH